MFIKVMCGTHCVSHYDRHGLELSKSVILDCHKRARFPTTPTSLSREVELRMPNKIISLLQWDPEYTVTEIKKWIVSYPSLRLQLLMFLSVQALTSQHSYRGHHQGRCDPHSFLANAGNLTSELEISPVLLEQFIKGSAEANNAFACKIHINNARHFFVQYNMKVILSSELLS